MRILQFNNYADPIGGAEVYALALTRELRSRGHTVGFFGTSPDREVNEPEQRVVRRPRYDARTLHRDPELSAALEGFLKGFRPDLIHAHNHYSIGLDVLLRLGSEGVPLVHTVHDFSLLCPNAWCVWADGTPCSGGVGAKCFAHDCHENYPFDAEVALTTLLKQRLLASLVDLAICPSRHLAELTRQSGARDVRHLNYFIDPIPTPDSLPRQADQLVFIGRLGPEKGIEHLLDAMPLILREKSSVRLTLVGGGELAAPLAERSKRLGLEASVTFLSHVPRAELGRFYATATACVIPSIWSENSPLVAYECLAAGLPMIASRIGGIPELVEEGSSGFCFTPRDPADLAAKALALLRLDGAERARMSAAMRARSLAFRVGPHLELLEGFYSELRAAPQAPRRSAPPFDQEFLTVLARFSQQKRHLGTLFHEHLGHIQHLESLLAAQQLSPPSAEGHSQLRQQLEASVREQRGRAEAIERLRPGKFLRRLARALHLPKLF